MTVLKKAVTVTRTFFREQMVRCGKMCLEEEFQNMAISCHKAVSVLREKTDFVLALAGNPNVGKSVIFNQLTGSGVVTANYPGKTVELNIGSTRFDDLNIGIIDLPGAYALGAISEDQWVARRGILDGRPDVVVAILDATNLERNLYLLLQLIDLGLPIVVALNLMDVAEKKGMAIDVERLSQTLGAPVIPTVAIQGKGLDELVKVAVKVAGGEMKLKPLRLSYGRDIEERIKKLTGLIERALSVSPFRISPRSLALLALENDAEFTRYLSRTATGKKILDYARKLAVEIEKDHGEPASLWIARERYGLAGSIATSVKQAKVEKVSLIDRLWAYTIAPSTGIPLLLLVLAGVFAMLFYVGNFLATIFSSFWAAWVSPAIKSAVFFVFGEGVLGRTLLWGVDAGIEAALAVGIPFVLTFYLILAVLEDSGYLNSVAFLADTFMHKLGLHGRAVIPMVAGAGCNVPAIIGTRVLTTARERTIASLLIVLVPCSARTAVIIGGVSRFAGWGYALAIFIISLVLIVSVGLGLNKIMPGSSPGLVMEMFPLRTPLPLTILKKTWYRLKDFIFVAFPIILGGSLILGVLYETGWLWALSAPLKPVVEDWLGLPAVAGLTLVFAVLRKELALQLLITFALVKYGQQARDLLFFMTKEQLFVYGLVNMIYIPCVATIAVLGNELDWRRAASIVLFTITLALLLGGIAIRVLPLLGL